MRERPGPRNDRTAPTTLANPLFVSLFNAFEIRGVDRLIAIPPSAQRLVALLALSSGPRERLTVAGTLWPDVEEERASACLRSALWRVRHASPSLVETTSGRLRLGPRVVTDVHELRKASRRVFDGSREVTDEDVRVLLARADLLPGWYEDWIIVERERIRQTRLHALELLCKRLTDEGRFAEAVEAGLATVHEDPLRETAQRALIAAYVTEGNASEAVRAYRRYQQVLDEQLGLGPSPEMRELLRQIVSPRPA
jgi:DNA-binding SARP family transcriptional activator